jgi:hypothetical protein
MLVRFGYQGKLKPSHRRTPVDEFHSPERGVSLPSDKMT